MPLLPLTLPSLRPHSHASRLPWLDIVLPLVLCHLSFSSCHCLLSGGTSTCPTLIASPPLVCPSSSLVCLPLVSSSSLSCCLLSCHRIQSACASAFHCPVTSHRAPLMPLVWLVVALPLIMPMPPVRRCLQLLSRHCLLLHPSCVSCPLWLVVVWPLLMTAPCICQH
jgi:hypothetical protein